MKIYRTSQQEQIERVSREAAEWLQAMKSDPATAEREAFAGWLASSPMHVREMLLAGMIDRELSGSGVLEQFDVEAIVARARAESNVMDLPVRALREPAGTRHRAAQRHVFHWRRAAAVAAVFLLGVAGWIGMRSNVRAGVEYATAIGEQRAIKLDDGTLVSLAPNSRIRVDLSSGDRQVTLRQGEAGFDVVHDASRPFRVYAGANLIQDIGTRFSVNRLPSGTVVSVTQGSVQVTVDHLAALDSGLAEWAASWLPARLEAADRQGVKIEPLTRAVRLVAGEAVHITSNGRALARGSVSEERQAPADGRRLTFHDDTLADIAAEFNRYNTSQIVIEGDALRLQRYSGVFDATDANSFLQFLDCCSQLAVIRHADHWVIHARAAGSEQRR